MDKVIYVAMSAAEQTQMADDVVVNNLANADTTGFKSDIPNFKSLYLTGGVADRAYNVAQSAGVNVAQGALNTTRRPLDVAMKGDAWLSVTTPSGEKGYVKSASLRVNANGILETQQGFVVNSDGGDSITLPEGASPSIDKDGGVSVNQGGQSTIVSQLGVQALPESYLYKSPSGLVKVKEEGASQITLAPSSVMTGVLEKSNVSSVDALVKMIDLSRNYETNINVLSSAKKNDMASNRMLDER